MDNVKALKRTEKISLVIMGFCAIAYAILFMTGCAAVVDPVSGEVILGVKAGAVMETAEQAVVQSLGQVPVIGPMLQSAAGAATLSGATVAGVARYYRNKLESARKKSDQQREAAERELARATAKMESQA